MTQMTIDECIAEAEKAACPTCKSEDRDCPGPGWIASGCPDGWHSEIT